MTSFLLDTNHASALMDDPERFAKRLAGLTDAEFGLCIPVIGELWFMVLNSSRIERNAAELEKLLHASHIWPLDELAAHEFGQIRVELRRQGRPIPQIDAQIAAIARLNRLTVLTADAHFASIRNLKTKNWLS